VSKKAELDPECLCFPERRFERNEREHHREGTTFFVELLEEFPRVIRPKLHLKIEDNRLHSNSEVKHRDLQSDFQ
jgi:hypothetical protein